MLQYMEAGSVYNAINFGFCGGYNYGAGCNATAWTTLIATFLCPSDNNAGLGGAPPQSNTNGTPNINSYRGCVGTTSLAGWNNGPGYGSCQPDPLNIAGGQARMHPVLDGPFCLLDCVRHQGLHRRHFADDRLYGVAGRRPCRDGFAQEANQFGDRRHRCPNRRCAGRVVVAGSHADTRHFRRARWRISQAAT